MNLREQQRISDANIQARNLEKQRQRDAERAQYQDKLSYAAGITGQQKALADFYGQQGAMKAQQQVEMGKGIGGLVDSGIAAYAGMPNLKSTGLSPDAAGGTTGYSRDYLSSPDYFTSRS